MVMEIFPVSCSLLVEIYISAEQQLALNIDALISGHPDYTS